MCGIFGVANSAAAARIAYWGIRALQHRGQESAGISATDGEVMRSHKTTGLVEQVFPEDELRVLTGSTAIAHTRYSTAGDSVTDNAQPIISDSKYGKLALGHNGNLINAGKVRAELVSHGAIFQSTSDSEVILHLLARAQQSQFVDALPEVLNRIGPAYSLVMLQGALLVGARDPYGFRPLCLGRLDQSYILASETTALDRINARYIREVEPGEIVIVKGDHLTSVRALETQSPAKCIFEHVYFARPDSVVFGRTVQSSRFRMGKGLAQEHPATADLVVPVPDSGVPAAVGYAEKSNIPFCLALIRDQYVGRSFITPGQKVRDSIADIKLTVIPELIAEKRVVLIDDSIVRATTMRKIVAKLVAAGAKEVHVRIACPPTKSPCFYGIDTPTKKELIASHKTIEDIRKFIGATTLGYLSLSGLEQAVRSERGEFCTTCYTGTYPTPLTPELQASLQL